MYPMIPCQSCGGGVQYVPELAGTVVGCPHCGHPLQMPGGAAQEPVSTQPEPEQYFGPSYSRSHAMPRVKRSSKSLIPSIAFGFGMALVLYFGLIRNTDWLIVELRDDQDTAIAAFVRKLASGLDASAVTGLSFGGLCCIVGIACFLAGRGSK